MLDCLHHASLMASELTFIFDLDLKITEGVQDLPGSHHSKIAALTEWSRRYTSSPLLGFLPLFVVLNKITKDNHLAVVLLNAGRHLCLRLLIVIRKAAAASAT